MNTRDDQEFTAQGLKRHVDDAAEAIDGYSDENKEQFETALQDSIGSLNRQLKKLETMSSKIDDENTKELDRLILKLQTERDLFQAKLKATQAETGEDWLHLKDDLRTAWHDVTETIEHAAAEAQKASGER